MSDDLKKKLIQYGDKVLFGVFVLVFIITLVMTFAKPNTLEDNQRSAGQYKPPEATVALQVEQIDQEFGTGGIPEAYAAGGFASDPDEINPRRGEKACPECGWIIKVTSKRCPSCGYLFEDDDDKDGMPNDWEDRFNKYESPDRNNPDADEDPDGDGFSNIKEYLGGSDPEDPKSIPSPFRLTQSYRKPVDILFKGFTIKEGGDSDVIDPDFWVMQINYGRNSQTAFIDLGGRFRGYTLFPLEKTKVLRKGQGGIPDWHENVYMLSIQRPNQVPIKLEKGKWGRTNETYIDLIVTSGRDSGKQFEAKTVGETIVANGLSFEIFEITDGKVTLKGSEGETYTLY